MEKDHAIWYIECEEPCSPTRAVRELTRYKLDLVGLHEVTWERRHCTSRGLQFFLWKGTSMSGIRNRIFFIHQRIVLSGRWYDRILPNAHAPTGKKCDDSEDNFCMEIEQVVDHFSKYDLKILLGDLVQNWRQREREDILNQQLGINVYVRIVKIMALE
jgi:hypothetical protein